MKIGWIVYNGFLHGDTLPHAVRSLQEAGEQRGVAIHVIKHYEVLPILENGHYTLGGKYKAVPPDFILFWDKDIQLAYHLEKMGFAVFNSSQAIHDCDHKGITYQRLLQQGLPIPKTILAPFQYKANRSVNISAYVAIANEIGYPLIIKECYGSFGNQVYYIENEAQMVRKVAVLQDTPFLFQEVIATSFGRDVRIQVVGDQCVASMLRVSKQDFRASITHGGVAHAYEPTEKEKALAIRATKALGLDFAGVDLLFGPNDEPLICEVNSNGNMKNLLIASGVPVAKHIIDYILTKNSKKSM